MNELNEENLFGRPVRINNRGRYEYETLGLEAHICREQALAAQVELLTHRLVEARMVVEMQAKYIIDQERRLREQGNGSTVSNG